MSAGGWDLRLISPSGDVDRLMRFGPDERDAYREERIAAIDAGWQVTVHAIDDRGARERAY
jgi:hypothetical protein